MLLNVEMMKVLSEIFGVLVAENDEKNAQKAPGIINISKLLKAMFHTYHYKDLDSKVHAFTLAFVVLKISR